MVIVLLDIYNKQLSYKQDINVRYAQYVFVQNKFSCRDEISLNEEQLTQIVDAALEIEEFMDCSKDFRNELK